uniref:ShK homolog Ask132958 n=1 Tax=Anemonia sulcata TaxID=6108 RepID=K1HH_ANESU|nr:RecName: Full=Ask132958; AltName: Full=U-ASTX-Asu1 [Anemonia sulcata]5WCV_A Chain A, ShK homolog AsK132958 [Anemonia sulcata]
CENTISGCSRADCLLTHRKQGCQKTCGLC